MSNTNKSYGGAAPQREPPEKKIIQEKNLKCDVQNDGSFSRPITPFNM